MLTVSLVYGVAISIAALPHGILLYGILTGALLPGACAVSALLFSDRIGETGEELRYLFSPRFRGMVNQKGIERQSIVVRLWEFYEENVRQK